MKIALFLPNWVGDAVMATPAIRAIRDHYAEAELVAVGRRPMDEVLAGTTLVDRFVEYAPRGKDPWKRGWRFASRLRAERFDAVLLFPNSWRSAWLAYLSGAKRRIGFHRDGRGILLTERLVPFSRKEPNPVINEYRRLSSLFGAQADKRMEIAVEPRFVEQLDLFWAGKEWDGRPEGWIALNPGGAFGAAKHWPTEHFAETARRLVAETGRVVLVLCGPSEREIAREIVRGAGDDRVFSLAEEDLSIGLSKAAVGGASLLISTDSGPRHFAAPLGVPVITLFGPTHIAWSETFATNAFHLQHPVDCGPCQQRVCPLGHHRCMVELTPERVLEAARMLLKRTARRAA